VNIFLSARKNLFEVALLIFLQLHLIAQKPSFAVYGVFLEIHFFWQLSQDEVVQGRVVAASQFLQIFESFIELLFWCFISSTHVVAIFYLIQVTESSR